MGEKMKKISEIDKRNNNLNLILRPNRGSGSHRPPLLRFHCDTFLFSTARRYAILAPTRMPYFESIIIDIFFHINIDIFCLSTLSIPDLDFFTRSSNFYATFSKLHNFFSSIYGHRLHDQISRLVIRRVCTVIVVLRTCMTA